MINFELELAKILKEDPLGILKLRINQPISQDQRLKESFEEINKFIDTHGFEPKESNDITERKLFSRLKQLRKDFNKSLSLKEIDKHKLLTNVKEIKSVDDIINNDALGILDDETDGIFKLRNVPFKKAKTDFYARRKHCKNFSNYEKKFESIQKDLSKKKRKLILFKESHLKEGRYFVLDGILAYLEKIEKSRVREFNDKTQGKRKRIDPRIKCIFENGLESNMLLRSFSKELYNNGSTVISSNEETLEEFNENFNITKQDKATGNVYVLSSLSQSPEIKNIKDLYKIGYTLNSVEERVHNAENQTTFLMAPVKIISVYKTYNLNPQKFEDLIHQVFSSRCLDVKIADKNGKLKNPKEWYIVPLHVIEHAIQLIINKKIQNYKFDQSRSELIKILNS